MSDLSPEIAERYRRAAQQRHLLPETAAAILRAVAWYRNLDEGLTSDGVVRRYDWQWLEDRDGSLTDQPLYPEQEEPRPITRDRFYEVWDTA